MCEAVFHGNHNPKILHYLIVESKCDPTCNTGLILHTLIRSFVICKDNSSNIAALCYLLTKSKTVPCVRLDNGKLVCIMCYPLTAQHFYLPIQRMRYIKDCQVCNSDHSCNWKSTVARCNSFLMFICKKVSSSKFIVTEPIFFRLLCYCIAYKSDCKCDFYKTLTKYESVIDKICLYCLSPNGLNDTACVTTLHWLIIKLDCEMYLSDKFIFTLLNCRNIPELLEEIQNHFIKKVPFRMADCIIRNYSQKMESLFQSIINELELTTKDKSGNTILHIACQYFHGDITLIENIIATGKADLLCSNNYGQTPLMLLSKSSEHVDVDSKQKVRQMITRFCKVKVSHSIESYVNLVVLGNPRAGKSSLVKVINDRSGLMSITFGRFKNVTGIKLHTAGIIPHILNDKDLGRIIVHDLAGQEEYYSSHTAVLENLLQGSVAVFVLVVSLDDESIQQTLQFWLTAIENVSYNALHQCHLFVVASHADLVTDTGVELDTLNALKAILSNRLLPLSSHIIGHSEIAKLDCRKLGGSQLDSFISSLSGACKSVSTNSTNSVKEMSLYCNMLYDFFQKDKQIVYRLESLLATVNNQSDLFLPTNIDSLIEIIQTLNSTGLIVFLKNQTFLEKSWIVVDKSILLSHLDGVLFAPEYFEQHKDNIASNTGVIKLSKLSALFPDYDSELLVQFLQYMQLCQVITEEFVLKVLSYASDNDEHETGSDGDQYVFVPALIKDTAKPQLVKPFTFGWYLRCIDRHQFFLSRFLHLMLLHLACKFSDHRSANNKFERLCNLWTTGIYWMDTKGVQTLVELADNKKSLCVLMSCERGCISHMLTLISKVIIEILTCKQQVMPKTKCEELIINNKQLKYPIQPEKNLFLYNIEHLAKCCMKDDKFIIDTTSDSHGRIQLSKLFVGAPVKYFSEAVFVGRRLEVSKWFNKA